MHRSMVRFVAMIAVAALVAAGCGGDDDDGEDAGGSSSVAAESSAPSSVGGDDADDTATTAESSVAPGSSAPASTAAGSSVPASAADLDPSVPVRYAITVIANQWDPHRSVSQAAETPSLVLVYDSLLRLRADGGVDPWLASSYEFSDDGLQLTLQLRDDVTFHDGSAFNADVVVANLQRAKGEQSTVASQLTNVVDVVADGPYEVRLVLERPDPTIALVLGTTTGAMISPAALDSPSLQQKPEGSGAFTLESSNTERNVFAAYPDYWNDSVFVADRIELIAVPDESARVNLLTSGGTDMINLTPGTWTQGLELAESDEYDMYTYSGSQQQLLYLNSAVPPLDNPEVRRALNLAIDREAIAEALDGACPADSQVFPEGYPGRVEGLAYEYDPEEARRILDEAGVGELTLDALQSNFEPPRTIGTIVQAMLAEIGVTLNLEPVEPAQARAVFGEGKYAAMVHIQAIRLPDPSALLIAYVGGPLDIGGAGDALIPAGEEAKSLELGSPERGEAYQAITEQLFEQPVHVVICNQEIGFVASAGLVGLDQLPYATISASVDLRGVGFAQS